MTSLIRTNSNNLDFQKLVLELDKDLAKKNGDSNEFFAQYNKLDLIKHVVLAYSENEIVGCGAMKEYKKGTMEIKRMYVPPAKRGLGIASSILKELERWAIELRYKKCVLETGDKMLEAISVYKKNNYSIIPNYGQYKNVKTSSCFEKKLL